MQIGAAVRLELFGVLHHLPKPRIEGSIGCHHPFLWVEGRVLITEPFTHLLGADGLTLRDGAVVHDQAITLFVLVGMGLDCERKLQGF